MDGSATFTIVTSRPTISRLMQQIASTRIRRPWLSPCSLASSTLTGPVCLHLFAAPQLTSPWLTYQMARDDLPVLAFSAAAEWEDWLAGQQEPTGGVWLKISKKGAVQPTVSYSDALDSALCFGWIDGQKGAGDEEFWVQRFTPRRPGSRWSKINAERAEKLIAAGRMRPAGLREVQQARADGRWETAYAGQKTSEVPDDLRAALDANPEARAFFETISRVNRYAILYRIGSVKRPETRARKIAQYVRMLAEHQTIH